MNKYQEALENIIVYPLKEECEHSPCCQCENECDFYKMKLDDYDTLKELVEKATPKKPLKAHVSYNIGYDDVAIDDAYECPICGKRIADDYMDGNRFDYCMHCGQAIDWSEEE